MKTLKTLVSTYLIHYTKLGQRLSQQLASPIGIELLPKIITEHCVFHYKSAANLDDIALTTAKKAEMMAQVTQINHILLYHQSVIMHSQKVEPCNRTSTSCFIGKMQARNLFNQALNAYSKKNIELSIQHLSAIKDFVGSDYQYCLILEDDACVSSKSERSLTKQIDLCLDMIRLLGDGFFDISDSLNFKLSTDNEVQRFRFIAMGEGQTRCASSYILTRQAAEQIIRDASTLLLPIDWHLSYLLNVNKIKTFWLSNPIFSQGSQTGMFTSNQIMRNLDE